MDDQNTPSEPVAETPAPAPEPVPTPVEPESSQPNGSTPTDLPPEAPELPTSVPTPIPVESQNGAVNQPESEVPKAPNQAPISETIQPVPVQPASSAPAPQTPQSPAQQDQTGFIRALLAKANAKLHSNRQKKLDKLMLLAQKKGSITNEDTQDLLHCSDATATRYLVRLVQQGRLTKTDGSHWVKYRFVR